MKRILKKIGITFLIILGVLVIIGTVMYIKRSIKVNNNYALLGEEGITTLKPGV